MIRWLKGKKTLIGGLLLSLLGAVWSLDLLAHDGAAWLSTEQYMAVGATIAGLTNAAMRLGIAKSERPDGRP